VPLVFEAYFLPKLVHKFIQKQAAPFLVPLTSLLTLEAL